MSYRGDRYSDRGSSHSSRDDRYDDRRTSNDRYDDRRTSNDRYDDRRSSNDSRASNQSRYAPSSRYDSRDGSQRDFDGQRRGGYQDNRRDDGMRQMNDRMSQMSVRSHDTNYSQHSTRGGRGGRGGSRAFQERSNQPGSAYNQNMPVAKKDLPYNTQEFAKRPATMVQDKVKVGEKVTLITNHALVTLPQETIKIYCYNIEIKSNRKPVIKRELAAPMFREIMANSRQQFPNQMEYIFNDVNILWTSSKLPNACGRANAGKRGGPEMEYKYTGTIDFGANLSGDQDAQLLTTLIDAIATARVRQHGRQKYTVFKRLTYLVQPEASEPSLPDVLLWKPFKWGTDARVGFSIAVKMNLRAGPSACFDLNHTMFNRPGYPLVRLLVELSINRVISDEEYEEDFDSLVRGAIITEENRKLMANIMKKMTLRYSLEGAVGLDGQKRDIQMPIRGNRKDTGREFKFYEIAASSNQATFINDQNQKMSIAQYYLNQYGIALRYPDLPCIQKKPSKVSQNKFIAFPIEFVSYIVDPTRYEGFAPESLTAEMIKYTCYTPAQRLQLLSHIVAQKKIAGIEPIVDNNDIPMKRYGVSIAREMLTCKATVLPAPTLVYGDGSIFHDQDHIGEWEAVRNEPMRKVIEESLMERNVKEGQTAPRRKVLLGSIICVENVGVAKMDYDAACYHRLMTALELSGQPVVWESRENGQAAIQVSRTYNQENDNPGDIGELLSSLPSNVDEKYKQEGDVIVPLVFLVFKARCSMTRNNWNAYNLLKQLGDNRVGVYTQGMLLVNFNSVSPNPQSCKLTCHMVEKILGKVGTTHRMIERGQSHVPWQKLTDPESPTLVLGIDVSHPSPREREEGGLSKFSVATVVGNIDTEITQFRASSRIQDVGEEMVVRMETQVQNRIGEFIDVTKKRPAHIVIYRDGICEGDFQKILYEERITIEEACMKISPDFQPTITYIVCSKRHHTRFFLQNEADGYEAHGFNIKPGTLIEDVVTTNKYYDFFLSTQVGMMGTVRPTHYYVLHDDWTPISSFWPTVTHALTYNFCRTTSTIALPAPLIYAHLAAKRAKETLDGQKTIDMFCGIHSELENMTEIARLTAAINVNKAIDGMTFV